MFKDKGNRNKSILVMMTGMIFVFFVVWGYWMIMTGDDYSWSSPSWWFKNYTFFWYDGRYLANLLSTLLTKWTWPRLIVTPMMYTLLVYLLAKIASKKVLNWLLPLSFLTFFLIPLPIFRQTLNWLTGSAVYLYPVLFSLTALYIFVEAGRGEKINVQPIWALVFAFMGQFGSENVTLGNLVLALILYLIVHYFVPAYQRLAKFYGLGIALGFISQFTNKAYWRIFFGSGDAYRSTSLGHSTSLMDTIKHSLIPNATFAQNILLALIAFAIVMIVVTKWQKMTWLGRLAAIVTATYDLIFSYFITRYNADQLHMQVATGSMELLLLTVGFFLLNGIAIYWLAQSWQKRSLLGISLFMAIVYLAPFAVVKPFGPRGIFASQMMLFMFMLTLQAEWLKQVRIDIKSFYFAVVVACLGMLAFRNLKIHHQIYFAYEQNVTYLNYQNHKNPHAKVYNYLIIPNWQYFWMRRIQYDDPELKAHLDLNRPSDAKYASTGEWQTIYERHQSQNQFFRQLDKYFVKKPVVRHLAK